MSFDEVVEVCESLEDGSFTAEDLEVEVWSKKKRIACGQGRLRSENAGLEVEFGCSSQEIDGLIEATWPGTTGELSPSSEGPVLSAKNGDFELMGLSPFRPNTQSDGDDGRAFLYPKTAILKFGPVSEKFGFYGIPDPLTFRPEHNADFHDRLSTKGFAEGRPTDYLTVDCSPFYGFTLGTLRTKYLKDEHRDFRLWSLQESAFIDSFTKSILLGLSFMQCKELKTGRYWLIAILKKSSK